MDKFVFGVCSAPNGDVKVKSIMANSLKDAQERIMQRYIDNGYDVSDDSWDDFLEDLYQNGHILISSTLKEIDEL